MGAGAPAGTWAANSMPIAADTPGATEVDEGARITASKRADVMATAHLIMERDYNQYQFETYLVLAVIYSVLCLIAWLIIRFFELRSPMQAPETATRGRVKAALIPNV